LAIACHYRQAILALLLKQNKDGKSKNQPKAKVVNKAFHFNTCFVESDIFDLFIDFGYFRKVALEDALQDINFQGKLILAISSKQEQRLESVEGVRMLVEKLPKKSRARSVVCKNYDTCKKHFVTFTKLSPSNIRVFVKRSWLLQKCSCFLNIVFLQR